MADNVIISPLMAKIIQKFSECENELEELLEAEDKFKAYENFELVLTLNGEEQLRIFEEGVQITYI